MRVVKPIQLSPDDDSRLRILSKRKHVEAAFNFAVALRRWPSGCSALASALSHRWRDYLQKSGH